MYQIHSILLIRHFKTRRIRSTTCAMRKIKWSSIVCGFEYVWKLPCYGFVQFRRRCNSVKHSLRPSVNHGHGTCGRGEVIREEMRDSDYGKLLSWLEDPEPSRFRPPSQSRLVQPCWRKAPSPPHLRRTHKETLSVSLDNTGQVFPLIAGFVECIYLLLPMGGCMWWLAGRIRRTKPRAVVCQLLTWNHLDCRVDFLPVLSVLKLPVQDEVAVVSDHRTLRARKKQLRTVCDHQGFLGKQIGTCPFINIQTVSRLNSQKEQ